MRTRCSYIKKIRFLVIFVVVAKVAPACGLAVWGYDSYGNLARLGDVGDAWLAEPDSSRDEVNDRDGVSESAP